MEETKAYFVECKPCGKTEEQGIDDSRSHIMQFQQIINDEFKCKCGKTVRGRIVT